MLDRLAFTVSRLKIIGYEMKCPFTVTSTFDSVTTVVSEIHPSLIKPKSVAKNNDSSMNSQFTRSFENMKLKLEKILKFSIEQGPFELCIALDKFHLFVLVFYACQKDFDFGVFGHLGS